MPSSALTALLTPAFTEAQALLGDTVYLNGAPYTGTFGTPRVQQQMLPGGGYRGRTVVTLTLTRGQFAVAPAVRGTVAWRHLSWRIESVDTHDPFHYVLTLIRTGE